MPNVHYRACNLCEAMCGVKIEFEGTKVLSIRGDEEDSFSRGHICPKATALQALYEDPDRLKQPLRRRGTEWEAISWDEALDEAARGLHDVQQRHGTDAVGIYLGNPNVHNTGSLLMASLFVRALKTKHRYSATSVDQLPHMLVAYWMFGHQLMLPVPDVDRTDYLLMLGANPLASNGSLMTAPDIRGRLDDLKKRGGKLIVIDPRRTETAVRADEHHFIQPGTDALLLLGMLHVVLSEKADVPPYVSGLEEVRTLAKRFPPERVAATTGLSADTIRRLARDFASAKSAVAYGRMGTSVQSFGAMCAWLINVLNIVTGNFDHPGGAMFPTPAFDPRSLPKAISGGRGSFGRWKSRVRGLPEAGGELPVATLAEDILAPGDGRVRAMVTVAGNPVLSTPNGRQLDTAFSGLEFMVAIDPYLNETTRHANLILPPPSPLEREHFDIAFHLLAVRNTVRYARALFDPGPNARHDWQILVGLAKRLERHRGFSASKALQWAAIETLGPEGLLDLGLRIGPRGGVGGLTLSKVRKAEHGIDLGPLVPVLPTALRTKSAQLELAPAECLKDVERLEATLQPVAVPGFKLINRRHLRDCNSWLHNAPKLVSGANRCTLLMHPEDARSLGLGAGDSARVRSRVGELVVPVELTDTMMQGVVSLPHGYGHGRDGVKLEVAKQHAGVSVNDLSDELLIDALSGNAALSGVPVQVERA
jgi:anaerobic selenocysteine-containing dehydrogenase